MPVLDWKKYGKVDGCDVGGRFILMMYFFMRLKANYKIRKLIKFFWDKYTGKRKVMSKTGLEFQEEDPELEVDSTASPIEIDSDEEEDDANLFLLEESCEDY
jgi:hypothetical protein